MCCVDGLGRVRANDDIIAICRERREREETITLLSGMSARTGQPGWPGSPVTARPVGPRLAIDSALDLDCDTGPGSQSRAEQLIPGPGSRVLFSLRAGPARAGAGIARRGLDCDTGPGGRDGSGAPWRVRRVQDRRNGHVSVLLDKC